MGDQEEAQKKKKKKDEGKLEFDPGKVFGPEGEKADDFNLETDPPTPTGVFDETATFGRVRKRPTFSPKEAKRAA